MLSLSLILSSLPYIVSIQINNFNTRICVLEIVGRWLYILAGFSVFGVMVLSVVLRAFVVFSFRREYIVGAVFSIVIYGLAAILQVFTGFYTLELS